MLHQRGQPGQGSPYNLHQPGCRALRGALLLLLRNARRRHGRGPPAGRRQRRRRGPRQVPMRGAELHGADVEVVYSPDSNVLNRYRHRYRRIIPFITTYVMVVSYYMDCRHIAVL